MLNVYANYYNRKWKLFAPLGKWLAEIMSRKPRTTLIVFGDFNSAYLPFTYMYNLSPPRLEPIFRRQNHNRLIQTRTDCVLCS